VRVLIAQEEDVPSWLALAAEVEPLFGPMVHEPGFLEALRRNIARGTAFCVRENGGPPGTALMGGLLFSPKPPVYTLGWLVVAARHRHTGVGTLLVEHGVGLVRPPAEMVVTTFGADVDEGRPARRFYERLGFRLAEMAPPGPEGGSRQVFRRVFT
jgi:GNAT superfamily N-acetyltransferase